MQICSAYRSSGGASVVVLSSRPKIEMEDTFRRIIPDEKRFNTQFVFRAGSPLVPGDLRRVAASAAASVIIVADTSRSISECYYLIVKSMGGSKYVRQMVMTQIFHREL